METTTQKNIWSIYYDDTEQKVGIYHGTNIAEILAGIRLIFDLSDKQELLFLDEDGVPIILSSAIPTQTKLYMQKKQSITDKVIEQAANNPEPVLATVAWYWLEPSHTSHKRRNDNLTVYQPDNQTQSHCFGSLVITSGKHYYTILIEALQCCVHAGIEASEKVGVNHLSSEFVNEINLKELVGESKGFGLTSKPAYELGFLVDMDQKELTVTDHREKKVLVKKTFPWLSVRPLVYFKHVVSMTITNMSLPTPTWI